MTSYLFTVIRINQIGLKTFEDVEALCGEIIKNVRKNFGLRNKLNLADFFKRKIGINIKYSHPLNSQYYVSSSVYCNFNVNKTKI